MSLSGVLVKKIAIKTSGDVFYELSRYKPHHILSPGVTGVYLEDGEWGTVGSIIVWKMMQDGKEILVKEILEAVDEEKKLLGWKVIEGDMLKAYKNYSFTLQVDTKGEETLVTWSIYYEKLNESVNAPKSYIDACINFTKDMDKFLLAKSS